MFLVDKALGGLQKSSKGGNIMGMIGGLIPKQGGGGGGGGGGSSNLLGSAVGGGGGGGGLGGILGGLGGALGGGGGGGLGGVLGGLGGALGGGGGGGGGAGGILGGIINIISDAAANYKPQPPPVPCANFTNVEANESEEVRQFRRLFLQLAGDDLEVCPAELMEILNKVVTRHKGLRTEGFSMESCRSMVAVMDSDSTGKLGFEEFKYLWNNIKRWQGVFIRADNCQEGYITPDKMPAALEAAGFQLHEQLQAMVIRRYGDDDGNFSFDNFISSLVRLDAMFRAFKALDRDRDGKITVNKEEWLKMTMYS